MAVDRCVCENRTFEQIQREGRKRGLATVRELQREGLCCTGCRLCAPYVARMLKTGQTRFDPIDPADTQTADARSADSQEADGPDADSPDGSRP